MFKDNNSSYEAPLVSVIVPNYRHEKYLSKRLRTIIEQAHENIEIILLDDASSDNSEEILTTFASVCEKVVALDINEENSGAPIRQWLKGVSLAKGEYIWIAESDDEAKPDLLTELLRLLSEHPSAGIAYCDSEIIDENSRYLNNYDYSSPQYNAQRLWESDFFLHGGDFVAKYMTYRNVIPNVSAVLFKASVLRDNLYECSFKYCADWATYNKILLSTDIAYSHKAMNRFRKHIHTTRWHDKKSYSIELREKVALLRALKYDPAMSMQGKSNIDSSLRYIFANRHKYRRVENLCDRLSRIDKSEIDKIYIFGANDIAERVIDTLSVAGVTPIVLDTNKAGQTCQGVEVCELKEHHINAMSFVVICSIRYQEAIQIQLEELGFIGSLLKV